MWRQTRLILQLQPTSPVLCILTPFVFRQHSEFSTLLQSCQLVCWCLALFSLGRPVTKRCMEHAFKSHEKMHSSSHENQLSLNPLNFPTGHWSIAFRYVMNSCTLDSVRWCFPLELINCTLLCEPAEVWGKTACAGICFGSNNAICLQKYSWQRVLKISGKLFSHLAKDFEAMPCQICVE